MRILIIDDDPEICSSLKGFFEDYGHVVKTSLDGESGLQQAIDELFDLIFLDIKLPGTNGLVVLEKIKNIRSDQQVVIISGEADLQTAVKATKLGAYNFLEKPLNPDKVLLEVKNIQEHQQVIREVADLKKMVEDDYKMVGDSAGLQQVRDEIRKAAPSDGRILIYGENGTGKELVAREIHQRSKRSQHPFVKVNCAAIPKDLIESELFGHEKGAFTGAIKKKRGMFEEADGGTLLLDEVGDLSLESQAKLLRVLQENEFVRVGGTTAIKFNIRIISATNKDLRAEIAKGRFREDLFFRLNVIPIVVPPLRMRKTDIKILADHFLVSYCAKNGKRRRELTDDAAITLSEYDWPGNVRELKNFIERLVIMSEDHEIGCQEILRFLPVTVPKNVENIPTEQEANASQLSLQQQLQNYEKRLLHREFLKADQNVSKMAKSLKTDRPNLHRKLKKYGIKN